VRYAERNEKKRLAYLKKIEKVPEAKRYYVNETGINKYLYREYGYAPRGERVYGDVPGKKYERLSLVAAKCGDEIIERHEYGGTMNSRLFEFWFSMLLKVIPKGSVIIMDNATFHRKKILKKMAKKAGCRVIFLSPYSPDFNPIEHVWANLKSWLAHYAKNFLLLSEAVYHYFEVG
jgi:transposase